MIVRGCSVSRGINLHGFSFASVLDFDFPFLSRRVSFKRSILYIYKFDEKNTREGETRKRKGSNSQFVENVFDRKCKL